MLKKSLFTLSLISCSSLPTLATSEPKPISSFMALVSIKRHQKSEGLFLMVNKEACGSIWGPVSPQVFFESCLMKYKREHSELTEDFISRENCPKRAFIRSQLLLYLPDVLVKIAIDYIFLPNLLDLPDFSQIIPIGEASHSFTPLPEYLRKYPQYTEEDQRFHIACEQALVVYDPQCNNRIYCNSRFRPRGEYLDAVMIPLKKLYNDTGDEDQLERDYAITFIEGIKSKKLWGNVPFNFFRFHYPEKRIVLRDETYLIEDYL